MAMISAPNAGLCGAPAHAGDPSFMPAHTADWSTCNFLLQDGDAFMSVGSGRVAASTFEGALESTLGQAVAGA